MSVEFWGEKPTGTWRVNTEFSNEMGGVNLTSMSITLYILQETPEDINQQCDPACATPTGCGRGNGSQYCDTCGAGYDRNASSLECVRTCSPGACVIEGVCVFYNGRCPDSTQDLITTAVIAVIIVIGITFCAVILTAVLAACIAKCRRKKIVVHEHAFDVKELVNLDEQEIDASQNDHETEYLQYV